MIRPGPLEIGLVLVIILIIFGVGKLPQLGGALGKGIRSFKLGRSGDDEEEEEEALEPLKKTRRKRRKTVKKATGDKRLAQHLEAEEKAEAKVEEKAKVKAKGKTL